MDHKNTFQYTYSAKDDQEVLNIRKKYLPREETKLEELKRLDATVQLAGMTESLCAGVGGAMVFGLGLCLALGVIGHIKWMGILVGLAGMAGMIAAYPVYRRLFAKAKAQYTPRILELAAELTNQ